MTPIRPLLTVIAAVVGLVATAGAARAELVEIAPLGDVVPGCPGFEADECRIVVARQTGFQVKVGTSRNFTTAGKNGNVVAWNLPLAPVADDTVKRLNTNFGGAPRAALVVLEPLGKSQFRVVQKGPLEDLTAYLGTTPTFALPRALAIRKGQVVGITVPTWAPMIQLGVGGDTSWRSSRPLKETVAENFSSQRALVGSTSQASFAALYQRARLTYSAFFVPNPNTNRKLKLGRDTGARRAD